MIDTRRFTIALAAGILPLLLIILPAIQPVGAFSLAGDPHSPGFRMAVGGLNINRMGLYPSSVEGRNTAHFDIGQLRRAIELVIERDVNAGSMIPGGQVWTVRVRVPVSVASNVDIYTSRACVNRVGLAGFGFLTGLLDGWLNSALANGLQPGLLTTLLNLVGPSGLINFTVGQMWGETLQLNAGTFAGGPIYITIAHQRTAPHFVGSCL